MLRESGVRALYGVLLIESGTVVGVAHDTHFRLLRESSPMVYLPSVQGYWQGSIAIRSTTALATLLPALRRAGREADPDVEIWQPQTMDEILDEPLAQPRLSALLASSFGVVALVLAAIGLFGVMGALVRDRNRAAHQRADTSTGRTVVGGLAHHRDPDRPRRVRRRAGHAERLHDDRRDRHLRLGDGAAVGLRGDPDRGGRTAVSPPRAFDVAFCNGDGAGVGDGVGLGCSKPGGNRDSG